MLFRQITHDDLGCASYLIGDRARRRGGGRRSALRDRRVPRARSLPRRAHHARARDPQPRRPRVRARASRGCDRRAHPRPPRLAAPDYEHEPFDDGWELRLGSLLVRALHTPGHRPEHTAFLLIDTRSRPRAVGGAERRQPVRRRRRAHRPGRGARGGRARDLPLGARAAADACPRDCEVWPAHLGGSMCGGAGHGHEDLLDDRLREAAQPDARDRRRGRVRARSRSRSSARSRRTSSGSSR